MLDIVLFGRTEKKTKPENYRALNFIMHFHTYNLVQ